MHFDQFEDEEAHHFLQSLDTFKKFSTELWPGRLEVETKLELPSTVTPTGEFFG